MRWAGARPDRGSPFEVGSTVENLVEGWVGVRSELRIEKARTW
jgi:hypothetical protein